MNTTTKCKANHDTGEGETLIYDRDTHEYYCPNCNKCFEPVVEEY